MFKHIMIPVDLVHKDAVERSVSVAADQAKLYKAKATLFGVSGGLEANVAHSETGFAKALTDYAKEMSDRHGVTFETHTVKSVDVAAEIDGLLLKAIDVLEADLVVMASHKPGWLEHLFSSHGGHLASHAPVSVYLVRG